MTRPVMPLMEPDLGPLEERYVLEALRSGWVSSLGPFVGRFERDFAALCGVEHCVALANGTVALQVALVARGIGRGDEVIIPDLTFVATAAAVVHAGATPVLVDVDPVTMCIDPALAQAAVTPRTRALVPVHLYGHPAPMQPLRELAREHSLFLLEDAAEAHGARASGRPVGSLGDAAAFSFYGNKVITTGEGGCITTNDAVFADRVRFLKDHAMSATRRYFHSEVGFNHRMTNLQAALGCAQLERVDEILARRAAIIGLYRAELVDSGIELNPSAPGDEPICWLVVARLPGRWTPERLRELGDRLREEHGIDTRPFFVPLHELPPYAGCRFVHGDGERSVSADLASRGLCLPSSSRMTAAEVRSVCEALRGLVG